MGCTYRREEGEHLMGLEEGVGAFDRLHVQGAFDGLHIPRMRIPLLFIGHEVQ